MRGAVYLEDLAVDQLIHAGPVTLSLEDITRFARDYDPQVFHTDPEGARDSFFGGVVASGWQTASMTLRMLIESTPFAGGVIGRQSEISWLLPVRPGDSLRVEARIADILRPRPNAARGLVALTATTFNQRNEIVQNLNARMYVASRLGQASTVSP